MELGRRRYQELCDWVKDNLEESFQNVEVFTEKEDTFCEIITTFYIAKVNGEQLAYYISRDLADNWISWGKIEGYDEDFIAEDIIIENMRRFEK